MSSKGQDHERPLRYKGDPVRGKRCMGHDSNPLEQTNE